MDHAHRGEAALAAGKHEEAVSHYTKALEQSPTAATYYIKRSIAFQRLSRYSEALEDSEKAVVSATQRAKRELIAQAQLRRGIALFHLERYGDAGAALELAKKLDDKEKAVGIWQAKVASKIQSLSEDDAKRQVTLQEVPNVKLQDIKSASKPTSTQPASTSTTVPPSEAKLPAATQTPANKIRHDWYQNDENIYLSILAKGVPKDQTSIDIQESSVAVSFPLVSGPTFAMSLDPLFAHVDASKSTSRILSTKIELVLKKAKSGLRWSALEGQDSDTMNGNTTQSISSTTSKPTETAPVYPTSSRSGPKNWDAIAQSFTKPPPKPSSKVKKPHNDKDKHREGAAEDESDSSSSEKEPEKKENDDDDDYIDEYEDADPVNGFFKKLYAGASDDTRRAMMKSYQESGGTALSTNWDEVKKDKVKVSPPDGMQEKKWGE